MGILTEQVQQRLIKEDNNKVESPSPLVWFVFRNTATKHGSLCRLLEKYLNYEFTLHEFIYCVDPMRDRNLCIDENKVFLKKS